MLVRELPDDKQRKLRMSLPPDVAWETIADLTLEELIWFFDAYDDKEEPMLIRDLPDEVQQQQKLREVFADDPATLEKIRNLTLDEAVLFIQADMEDRDQRMARKQRRWAVEDEIDDLARSVREKYPDIKLRQVEYFLQDEVSKRFQALMRELHEMSHVPLVARDRQPSHQAVEEEITFQLKQGGTYIDSVVAAVLKRNPAYPPERVREYATYILRMGKAKIRELPLAGRAER
jgi:hypothetical protein